MDIKKALGKRIQECRKSKKMTQEQLAEIIEIDTISLSKIETGKNYPTAENLSKIADILGVEVYELFIPNKTKTNEELLTEIKKDIEKLANDNISLHKIYAAIKSLV